MNKAYKEFKTKLDDLLREYQADISFDYADCSDTYGIYDPCIQVGSILFSDDNTKREQSVTLDSGYYYQPPYKKE